MWRWTVLALLALVIIAFGFSLMDTGGGTIRAEAVLVNPLSDTSGFARADAPYNWQFPLDFGAHPAFQTEWWYYTGNLKTADGRHFGYQFTIFRRALAPPSSPVTLTGGETSEWRADQIYMAHFALSDVAGGRYFHQQRFSRGSAGLAGATTEPVYRVWLEDWQVVALEPAARRTRIYAHADDFGVELVMDQLKPPALHGDNGLSPKSDEPGSASYYYSLTRLKTAGEIVVNGETFQVSGASWKDHEFSTSALGADAQGWDWFGLQLDDNRELMLGQIRMTDGSREPAFGGLLVEADGSTRYLSAEDFSIETTATWTSPHTGAVYPAGWNIAINTGAEQLAINLTPLLADQELHGGGGVDYWEGAVAISGGAAGYGYAELTGYAQAMTGRF
ncbi:MAG: carotenoid 1,2-hydratase [Chloroflexota bacterium]|nr:MAG: carotenoid 1,2-hydratase [Chloroflexota bacterium]